MAFYRPPKASGITHGVPNESADAARQIGEGVIKSLGGQFYDPASAQAQVKAFSDAYNGVNSAKLPVDGKAMSSGLARMDVGTKAIPKVDLSGGLAASPHKLLDMAGHMGDPTLAIFKGIVEMLQQIFSAQAATDLIGTLPPMELYSQAAYESTKFLTS